MKLWFAVRKKWRRLSAALLEHKDGIAVWKDVTSVVQSCATVVGLVLAGYWTYTLFVVQRQGHPHLKLEHRIAQRKLPSGEILLSVDELLSNSGSVLVTLHDSDTRIIQVLPFPSGITEGLATEWQGLPELSRTPKVWLVIRDKQRHWGDREKVLEPGEDDQLHSDFVLPPNLRSVAVATHILNPSDSRLGWQRVTVYDVGGAGQGSSESSPTTYGPVR